MWLGTLAVIVIVGIPAALKAPDSIRPGERVAGVINTFSPVALTCGGVVVATGLASSLMHLPTLATLWTSLYGVALLLKLFFVALLFAAGAWNWQRMKPRLTGENAIGPLRSSASLELVLGAVVLTITAILVALELP
jgi:putative copper export protein